MIIRSNNIEAAAATDNAQKNNTLLNWLHDCNVLVESIKTLCLRPPILMRRTVQRNEDETARRITTKLHLPQIYLVSSMSLRSHTDRNAIQFYLLVVFPFWCVFLSRNVFAGFCIFDCNATHYTTKIFGCTGQSWWVDDTYFAHSMLRLKMAIYNAICDVSKNNSDDNNNNNNKTPINLIHLMLISIVCCEMSVISVCKSGFCQPAKWLWWHKWWNIFACWAANWTIRQLNSNLTVNKFWIFFQSMHSYIWLGSAVVFNVNLFLWFSFSSFCIFD